MRPHKPVAPPDLYCITDPSLSPLSVEEQVREMVTGGARLVQLRHKHLSAGEFTLLAQRCATICHWEGATFLVNDHVEAAALSGADGVHLGQGDMAPTEARTALGDEAVIGVSTHNLTQLRAALEAPVDYIALGPVFGTSTKQNPEPTVGLAVVEQAVRALEGDYRPLVLIGGITMERLPELRRIAPRAFYAVIGDVLRSPSIEARVRAYRAELGAK